MPVPQHHRRTAPVAGRVTPWQCEWFGLEGAVSLRVRGELDLLTAPTLDASLRLAQGVAELVVLDLRELEFIDCSGIRCILHADRRAHAWGDRLAVVRGPVEIELFLRITGSEQELWLVDQPSAASGSLPHFPQ